MSQVQFVVFSLGKEEYGVEINFVQEIVRIPEQTTKLPNMPSYIEGMVNLRGQVFPVIDLKKRFGLEQTERGIDSRLLVLDLDGMLLGTIVDDVSEVLKIDDQSIEQLNSQIASIGGNSVKGIGKIDDRLILLLDAMKLSDEVFKEVV